MERFVEPEDAAAEEDAQRREQGPEEALPPVPERMSLIRGPDAAQHADQQEHLDRHVGGIGRGLGAQGHRPGHPGRHRQPERFGAIYDEGNDDAAARCPAPGWRQARNHSSGAGYDSDRSRSMSAIPISGFITLRNSAGASRMMTSRVGNTRPSRR